MLRCTVYYIIQGVYDLIDQTCLVSRIFGNKFYLLNHLIIAFKLDFLYYWR